MQIKLKVGSNKIYEKNLTYSVYICQSNSSHLYYFKTSSGFITYDVEKELEILNKLQKFGWIVYKICLCPTNYIIRIYSLN